MNKKLLVTGDIFRPNENEGWSQTKNINVLYQLISLPLRCLGFDITLQNTSDGLSTIPFSHRQLRVNNISWASFFYSSPSLTEVEWFSNLKRYDLIIGFELSPFLLNIFKVLGLTYVNVFISPIRFLAEHLFIMTSNNPTFHDRLKLLNCTEKEINRAANRIISKNIMINDNKIWPNSCIISGQTPSDRVLINSNGCFDKLQDYQDYLANLTKEFDHIYFKPHPHNKGDLPPLKNIPILDGDFYNYLSQPNLRKVVSISSSTSIESNYFGVEGVQLEEKRYSDLMHGPMIANSIDDECFWEYVLLGSDFKSSSNFSYLPVKEIYL